ncbi:MAG: sigma-54 dependent transcriptional regulator [Phycisphaeraceae bacterium]
MIARVLVVDDKQMMRDSVGATLQRAGYRVIAASDGVAALDAVARHRPAAVVTDLKMPEMDGLELLRRLRTADDQLPVVLMTAYGSVNDAVEAMKQGAFDFIQKPFEGDQLVLVVGRAVEHRRLVCENEALRSEAPHADHAPRLIGRSPAMRAVAEQIERVADSHGTVMISGESGTGKEVVARTIHAHSPRREAMMLCLNCAALSSNLLESELFGHERGAFTGADQLRKGRFELADGGTLLLDEISEIGPELQAKLLRVLQEGEFERVGSSTTMQVNVRVVATTNRDLSHAIEAGDFRQDLYYRLNVLPIHLPPLRDRLDDVDALASHFLARAAKREGREPKQLTEDAVEVMRRYGWPGNVRELQNICERASVLARGSMIEAGLIQPWLSGSAPEVGRQNSERRELRASAGRAGGGGPAVGVSVKKLEDLEREQILHTLGQFNGNRQRAAEALGIGLRTLGLKLKKWKEQNLVAQSV